MNKKINIALVLLGIFLIGCAEKTLPETVNAPKPDKLDKNAFVRAENNK